jgi:hypothetical protein
MPYDRVRPIDLLGGGQVVLPPSRGSKARYEIIHGSLDDLTALTTIKRPVAGERTSDLGEPGNRQAIEARGGRNATLFDMPCKEARRLPPDVDTFIARACELNRSFGVP